MKILEKKFYFLRHGQTDWNLAKRCQGHKDIPLNAQGLQEAKEAAIRSRILQIECIVTSPLLRAFQTAKQIHLEHPLATFHVIDTLKERGWGEHEGIVSDHMYRIEELEEKDPVYVPGKGVESREDLRSRILEGIVQAQSFHPHPLIVGHGRAFMEFCHLLSLPLIRQVDNCQIFELFPTSEGWKAKNL